MLKAAIEEAVRDARDRRADAGGPINPADVGLYLQFESQPNVRLDLRPIESIRSGIELAAFSRSEPADDPGSVVERATVFVPEERVRYFLSRLDKYSNPAPKTAGEQRHEALIDPIAAVRLATLRALWTDRDDEYPLLGEPVWWEIWLRKRDGGEISRLVRFAAAHGVTVHERRIVLGDRIVTLVRGSAEQLSASVDVLADLAEIRKANEVATFFDGMSPVDQGEWTKDLTSRTVAPHHDASAVCLLDTGVTQGHPLLSVALAPEDCHAYDPSWGTHDHHGHGTTMAGLALYGDLTPVLASAAPSNSADSTTTLSRPSKRRNTAVQRTFVPPRL